MKISFELFNHCEALKSLSLTRLHEECRIWINDKRRSTIRELIVEEHYGLNPLENGLLGKLNLPHLSKLTVNQKHGWCPVDLEYGYEIFRYSIIDKLENKGSQLKSLAISLNLRLQGVFISLLPDFWLILMIIEGVDCPTVQSQIAN
jgi:hypothetical protein